MLGTLLAGRVSMGQVRLSFDRGTLRVDGEVEALLGALHFDARAGFHRASSHRYTELLALARERGLDIDDRIGRVEAPRAYQARPRIPAL